MKNRTISFRILSFLICIAIMSIGMYTTNTGVDSFFSYPDSPYTMSSASNHLQRVDATNEVFGGITDEITPNISSGTRNTFTYRPLPLINVSSMAVQPFLPLFIWIVFIVLFRNEFVDRMYLILFIHNSDGEKGAGTPLHNEN